VNDSTDGSPVYPQGRSCFYVGLRDEFCPGAAPGEPREPGAELWDVGLLDSNPNVAIAMLCIGGFAHQSLSGVLISLSADVFGKNVVATANGLTGTTVWTASTLFAPVVGAAADKIGFSPLYAALFCFDLLAVA
jgi:hypothetical protein